MKATKSVTL